MDKHFLVGVITIGVIGVVSLIAGAILMWAMNNVMAGATLIGIGSNVVSGVLGLMMSPKPQQPQTTLSDLINYTTAQAVLNPKGEQK